MSKGDANLLLISLLCSRNTTKAPRSCHEAQKSWEPWGGGAEVAWHLVRNLTLGSSSPIYPSRAKPQGRAGKTHLHTALLYALRRRGLGDLEERREHLTWVSSAHGLDREEG